MNINLEKDNIIKRFNKINDIHLIRAIKNLVDFGLKKEADKTPKLSTFFGILSEDEANNIQNIINDGCEKIDENEW